MFDGEFDIEDAAICGGVLGFIEESAKDDDTYSDNEIDDVVEDHVEKHLSDSMRLLNNENPSLVNHLIRRAYESRAKYRDTSDIKEVFEEIADELIYQKGIRDE